MMRGWLYLHFPDLYRHSLAQDSAQPFAVLHATDSRVLQLNKAAEKYGIARDMPLASALYLCPELHAHTLNEEQQRRLLEQRALWAYQFSAQICPDPTEGLWLEAGSMLSLFGGLDAFWERIASQCQQQQWPVQMATGLTPLAARWLALADAGRPTLSAAALQPLLQSLPLDQLQLDLHDLAALQRLGISTLGELLRLPLAETGRRISVRLMQQLRQLLGETPLPMQRFQPPLTFHADVPFLYEVEHRNGLLFPLSRQLDSLSGFLCHHQLATRWLDIQLVHREPPDTHWRFGLARPEYRHAELVQICRYQLEKKQLRAPVLELHLRCQQFQPQVQRQQTCLSDDQSTPDEDNSLLNRLQSRLGTEQLQRISSNGDPRPEYSWHPLSLEQQSAATPARDPRERPLWLLQTPLPCSPPTQILCGPERIDAGWWDHHPVRRDYYQVLAHEQLLWIFRDDQGQWFIQGYFA